MLFKPGFIRKSVYCFTAFSIVSSAVIIPPSLPSFSVEAAKRSKFKDQCKNLRKPFSKIKNRSFEKSLIGGILGVVAGAVVGSMIKSEEVVVDKNGNRQIKRSNKALEGAIAGGFFGAGIGYLSSLEQGRQDRAALQKALGKHSEERIQYNDLDQKLADLGNCRTEMLFNIEQDLVQGNIDPLEAKSRLETAKKWIAKDDEIITKAAKLEGESITAYAQAVAVMEGESAEVAKADGDAMVQRYAANVSEYESSVEVTYDVSEADLAAAAPSTSGDKVEDNKTKPILGPAFVSAKSGARVRAEPNKSSKILGAIAYRTKIEAAASDVAGWSMVKHEAMEGFTASSLISLTEPAKIAVANPKHAQQARPDLGPAKIRLKKSSKVPTTTSGAVSKAAADGNSFKETRAASNGMISLQIGSVENRIRAALR